MQIKYNTERDIFFIDFEDRMAEFEKKEKPTIGVCIVRGSGEKIRGVVVWPAKDWLPPGFMEKVEQT